MSSLGDYNQRIIDEFRASDGKPPSWGGTSPLLLLHHRGARSGVERVNPVAYLEDGGRYVIFASKAGAPTNPSWYHNLKAHPETTVEVDTETLDVTAARGQR
jgi:deazaflavin-dependent oxidoreductase (nitroreductase family)